MVQPNEKETYLANNIYREGDKEINCANSIMSTLNI